MRMRQKGSGRSAKSVKLPEELIRRRPREYKRGQSSTRHRQGVHVISNSHGRLVVLVNEISEYVNLASVKPRERSKVESFG